MILIVGLGNPGKKYTKTRHNVGFRIIDALEKSFDSAQDKKVVLLKPDTFMNNSGKAVRETLTYYKVPTRNLCVIHDEIDLPFGTIRISKNSSSAGHKGVQSIIDELKTKNFTRVRIGIRPEPKIQSQKSKIGTTNFVLKNFTKGEEKQLKVIVDQATETIKKELRP